MRRSGLALFCTLDNAWTQRVRIVAGEKGLPLELVEVPEGGRNAELAEMSPDATLPTLVDRDVLLFDSRVIIDYLDERFPHPPLMPIDPVTRAQFRVALHRIERDWYPAAEAIARSTGSRELPPLRERLRALLLDSAALFKVKRFFLSDEFSLVDATIAPILWRLPALEVDLGGPDGQAIMRYANQIFARPAFQRSLQDGRIHR
jgi:RNA polymerase-associated protein